MKKNIFAVCVFYLIALLLRYLTNRTGLLAGVSNTVLVTLLQGVGPTVGAVVAMILFRIKPVMSLQGVFSNLFIPFSIYWLFPVVLIGAFAFFTNGTLPIIAIFTVLAYGLLEEIGWRGFLQQQLSHLPKFIGILLIAVLWFVWHLNFDLTSANLMFFLILLLGSWGIGLVARKTNSLLAAAAFHSLNNFFGTLDLPKAIIVVILVTIWVLSIVYRNRIIKQKNNFASLG